VRYVAGIFAFLTGAADWFYLFYSRAALRLSAVEDQRINGRRVALRRAGGFAMFLLGALFFAGFYTFDDPREHPRAFVAIWLSVFALLIAIVVLAMIDLRLTRQLRRNRER
jgi:hypothetical protein